MKVVIDTSSLLALVRYYLPFDQKSILLKFFKDKVKNGEIILIDKVMEECEYTSKGIVLTSLPFLTDKDFLKKSKLPIKTDTMLAPSPQKFLRQVDNNFVNTVMKSRLTFAEYDTIKSDFLKSADMRMIIYCLNLIKNKSTEEIILVTEESGDSNDAKYFKKIPAICKELGIASMTLPECMKKFKELEVIFKTASV